MVKQKSAEDAAFAEDVNRNVTYQRTSLASNVVGAKALITESAADLTKRSELRNGFKYAKSELGNLKTLSRIGTVAKYAGGAASITGSLLSTYKIVNTGSVSASDVLNYIGTGVAVAALIVSSPVSVSALAVTGAVIGVTQLVGGGFLDDVEIYNINGKSK